MKILVGIKHVPDTEAKIKVGKDGRSVDETGVKMIISPFDEYALEEALLLRDASGGGEVVAVSTGREAAQTSLRQALAMGADRAVLVHDDRYDRTDALARAEALAAVARAEAPDLIFVGKTGVGTDDGQTGPMVAEILGWGHAAAVVHFELRSGGFLAKRTVEGAIEVVEGPLPALIAWDKSPRDPRYASLKGIMAAKKKPLAVQTPASLGLALADRPRIAWEAVELPPARQAARIIDGEPAAAARELVRVLREEAKVI